MSTTMKRRKLNNRGRRTQFRPGTEPLEPRMLLAVVTWDGGGSDLSWGNRFNWSDDTRPQSGDTVEIGSALNHDFAVLYDLNESLSIEKLTSYAGLTVSRGELLVSEESHLYDALTVSGAIMGGPGNIVVNGPVSLVDAVLRGVGGEGSLHVEGSTSVSGGTTYLREGYELVNAASGNFTITSYWGIWMNDASTFRNDGTMRVANAGYVTNPSNALVSYDAASEFVNNGLLQQFAMPGGAPEGPLFRTGKFINTEQGRIEVSNGLRIGGGNWDRGALIENAGTIAVASGATLAMTGLITSTGAIHGGNVVFGGGSADISGHYAAEQTGAGLSTVTFTGAVEMLGHFSGYASTFDLSNATLSPAAHTFPSLSLISYSTLITDEDLTVTGAFNWGEAILRAVDGHGSLRAEGVTNHSEGSGFLQEGFQLVNAASGDFTITSYWGIWMNDASTFRNDGTMRVANAGYITNPSNALVSYDAASEFVNNGLLQQFAMPGGAPEGPLFRTGKFINTEQGRIEVSNGLRIGGGNPQPGALIENAGTINVASGASLEFSGRFDSVGQLSGGSFVFGGGPTKVAGSYNAQHTSVSGATAVFAGDVISLGHVSLYSSTLDLTDAALTAGARTLASLSMFSFDTLVTDEDLSVEGAFLWHNATLRGADGHGSLTLKNNVVFDQPNSVRDFTLINTADAVWSAFGIAFYGESRFVNAQNATFENTFDGSFGSGHGGCAVFENRGTFIKSTAAGVTNLHMQLYNSGLVNIQQGTLNIGCGYVQINQTSGGSGTITGGGTMIGDVSVAIENDTEYEIQPSPTPVPPVSNFTQTPQGTLIAMLGGVTLGVEYGQILVTGEVHLAGNLEVTLANGFLPQLGDAFVIIDNQGETAVDGTWQDIAEGTIIWVGAYAFNVSYQGGEGENDVVLTVAQIAASATISGRVYDDANNDGSFVPTDHDLGIGGVAIKLYDEVSGSLVATTTTALDGTYQFDEVEEGSYSLIRAATPGFLDGDESAGNRGGIVDNETDSNEISGIIIGSAGSPDAVDYLFGQIRPSSAQGLVWLDFNDDGEVNFGETPIAGVEVELLGRDDRGSVVSRLAYTDADGAYFIEELRPSDAQGYTLREVQPGSYRDGKESVGTVHGVMTGTVPANDSISGIEIFLPGSTAQNYNFAERAPVGLSVGAGQSAGIGFWQNKIGQRLIHSLNGGASSTQLGNWLAATFPNMFGAAAGENSLGGKTNTEVAAYYQTLFGRNAKSATGGGPPKIDAQVLATVLATYVTNNSLAGNVAGSFGFQVTDFGLGASTWNVGARGAAFDLPNNASATVLDLLLAVNARSRNGLLYDLDRDGDANDPLETYLRNMVNDLFSSINEVGP